MLTFNPKNAYQKPDYVILLLAIGCVAFTLAGIVVTGKDKARN